MTDTPASRYGIIARNERLEPALAAGADYVEPIIVGTLAVRDGERWTRNPDYRGPAAAGSFAILVPGDVRLSDPDADPALVERYFSDVIGIVAAAAAPGARIVLGSGAARSIAEGTDAAAARAAFARSVIAARDAAERHGLRIVLEPLNRRESNLINSLREAADFLDEFGIERVDLVADLHHIMVEGEPLSQVVALGARIGHAHVCDTERTPPGQGDWPIPEFIRALRDGGYTDTITVEADFTDFVPELEAALAHLRGLA